MNIRQSVPRVDCKAFAKCGVKSLSHCRRYRDKDEECVCCELVKRRERGNFITTPDGRIRKKCSVCGHFFFLHRFYPRTLIRREKTYYCYSSECRQCKSEKVKARLYVQKWR